MALREIVETDYPGVQALHRSVGWPPRSLAGWRWLHANPARQETEAPAGWVADGPDGALVGHVGNLIQRFHLGDQVLHGATGFSIIVLPSARGTGREMLRTFNAQQDLFALWTFNANPLSSPLYARHGMAPWPETTHALKLGWPLALAPLVLGRALKTLHNLAPGPVSGLGEQLMNDRLGRAARLSLPPGVVPLTDFGDRSSYADFWQALKAEDRLLSDRSPEILRWRLQDPDLTQPPLLLGLERDGVLTGYALAMMAKGNTLEPPVLEIVDLEALADQPDAIPTLMAALKDAARQMGAAKLRLQTVAPRMLSRLGRFARTARPEGGWGHCHVRFAPGAPSPDLWAPTPWDGDYVFCLRPAPIPTPVRAGRTAPATSIGSKA
ncbi:N-acetyltransferase [Brevundimonas sp.]|uniref:N-acetyltransferase n=1 Tax=Brevundimonas sp. TaxID=1871086 RepID=UPI002737E454|nr:N-acetyltransferase [Brevundimonas sp.]MDP3803741.1 N-acetyltransferase [Brevundimonas sp.]